jgi:hypothetical protein
MKTAQRGVFCLHRPCSERSYEVTVRTLRHELRPSQAGRATFTTTVFLPLALLFAFSPQPEVRVQQREIHKNTFHFKYPEIANAPHFNAAVRKILAPLMKEARERPRDVHGDFYEGDTYVHGQYRATTLENGVISVLFTWTQSVATAVHPWGGMASINYDTRSGRVLRLAELFRPGGDYLSRLSQLAIASLMEQRTDDEDGAVFFQGAGPSEANFKAFTLTNTALVLHFPAGQAAHHVLGNQEVVIPLDLLADLLRRP